MYSSGMAFAHLNGCVPIPLGASMTPCSRRPQTLALLGVLLVHVLLVGASSCDGNRRHEASSLDPPGEAERNHMVDAYIIPSGIKDPAVLAAMRRVPRHRFVPAAYARVAYMDGPLPIGHGQTISQPSLVAKMTEALALQKTDKVLEVGTGSGYQAAVLAELVAQVLTVEILAPLARQAEQTLGALGYRNVRVRVGDGYQGWPEEAPFNAIIVTAAPDHVPQPLLNQLAINGRLILPVGTFSQTLDLYRRTPDGYEHQTLALVRFVPLVRPGQQEE
jgi:protein-L-isoaspartate(D-aspartate) O-methyltransferase